MSRYIDADLMREKAYQMNFNGRINERELFMFNLALSEMPTIDAIERLTDEIDRKDKALQAWVKTWESRKENAIRHICDHCDTPIEVRLKEGACEDCPIKILIKEIFDE